MSMEKKLVSIRALLQRASAPGEYVAAAHERVRAHKKHVAAGLSVEDRGAFYAKWLPIFTEEVGEVAKVLCETPSDVQEYGCGAEYTPNVLRLREELVQVAAMSLAWIAACDRELQGTYNEPRCDEHYCSCG